ncbi:hypothetical protein N9Y70_02465 [Methylophilaceae bacterium]|nr:hypothetical protein [Methylophilaceae bacterium]
MLNFPSKYLLLILFLYFAIFGSVIYLSNGIPFIFDNNESFSAWWHAYNSINFGFTDSYGLADESFSYDKEAHPFAYTHAGTMPRLWVEILFRIGFPSIESQIVITCFSIGLLAILFSWNFFKSISNNYFAFLYVFLLITNYVSYTQWHLGSWQIWKSFFLFGTLAIINNRSLFISNFNKIYISIFLFFMFYYEHVFSFFILLTSFLYLIIFKDKFLSLKWLSLNIILAIFTAILIITQVVFYLGLDAALNDIYYTFIGRNFSTNPSLFLNEAQEFYKDQNIAFWMNIPDATLSRSFVNLLNLLRTDFNLFGPLLTSIFLFGYFFSIFTIYKKSIKVFIKKYLNDWLGWIINLLIFSLPLLLSFYATYLLDVNYNIIWSEFDVYSANYNNHFMVLVLLMIINIMLLIDKDNTFENYIFKIKKIIEFSFIFLISMIITFYIFSGYVSTGYIARNAPFSIYVTTLIFSISIYFYFGILKNSFVLIKQNFFKINFFISLFLILLSAYLWISIQFFYLQKFHPNGLGFRDALSSKKLEGKTFTGQAYGGTMSYFTKNWSFLDGELANFILKEEGGKKYLQRGITYKWFADKESNYEYNFPEYYLLFHGYSIGDLIYELNQKNSDNKINRVSRNPIFTYLQKPENQKYGLKVFAHDKTGQDRWSIIKLDWNELN